MKTYTYTKLLDGEGRKLSLKSYRIRRDPAGGHYIRRHGMKGVLKTRTETRDGFSQRYGVKTQSITTTHKVDFYEPLNRDANQ